MNQMRRTDPTVDEVSELKAIVRDLALPDFVTGVEIELGEFNGDPTAWITFRLSGSDDQPLEVMRDRSRALAPIQQELRLAFLKLPLGRFPLFRYDYADRVSRL